MATVELTRDNFEQTVDQNDIVLVDFWAPWCGPCRSFGPVFEAASEKHTDIVFGKVNSDDQQELAGTFNVRSIPFVMLMREKVVVFAQAGALPPEGLESIIGQARALDMERVRKDIAEQESQQRAADGGQPA
jgi:thioredoxin 1/thioredoxin 2